MASYSSIHTGAQIDNVVQNALLKSEATAQYLSLINANANFLTKNDASTTYLRITDAQNNYLQKSDMITLVWTNPNPYSYIAKNTVISMDLSEYQAIIIVLGEYVDDTWRRDSLTSHFCIVGQRHICPAFYLEGWNGNGNYNTARSIIVETTGITLSQARTSTTGYSDHCIPRWVYGVKIKLS